MAGPQPDLHQLGQHLAAASQQINLIPNMPVVIGFEVLIANLQEQHAAALAQQAQHHAEVLAQQAQHHAAALAQQAQQTQHIVNRLDTLQEGLDALQERYVSLLPKIDYSSFFVSQMRLPMQLYNASASPDAPLQFPPGMDIVAQFITRKQDVLTLNGKFIIL